MTGSETARAFSILAVDGGGARGIFAAQLLARVEQALGQPIRESFDLLAGTSTGSIITGAAAVGISMDNVVRLFEEEAPRIFRKSRLPSVLATLFRSRYSAQRLATVLNVLVPGVVLVDVQRPLLITSADIATGGVHVFKSRYLRDLGEPYERDGGVLLSNAILASCAAPTYFDPRRVGAHLLADGGLWANNPSIIAVTEALSKFKREVGQIWVFSLGTGHTATMYGKRRHWGLLTGWGREKLIDYTLGLQSQSSSNMAQLILENRYRRIDPEIDDWPLDDTEHMSNLKALADKEFTYKSADIIDHIRGGLK